MKIVTVDLGGTLIKLGVVENGRVIARRSVEAMESKGLLQRLPDIRRTVEELLASCGSTGEIDGLACGFPGIMNIETGEVLATPKYRDVLHRNLLQDLEQAFDLPARIDNDSRLACLGEWKAGAGRGTDNLVMVTLGTGFGSSAVIGGRLLRGAHFQAGILGGHQTIDVHGIDCVCGNRGCVETLASSWRLPDLISGADENNEWGDKDAGYAEIFANKDHPVARRILEESFAAWGSAVVNLIHAYDTELVILGGGIMKSGHIVLPAIRDWVDKYAWTPWGRVQLKPASLGDDAAILGGYYLWQEKEKA